jgi:hypothetical protein
MRHKFGFYGEELNLINSHNQELRTAPLGKMHKKSLGER